jgi:hypothetical protein
MEVGLHCYDHRIYLDAVKDRENIRKGAAAMTGAGIPPAGFAAPFGFWSPDVGKAIDAGHFGYSSEFSWACDCFPHYPMDETARYATLQVPVHPIAIGGLLRAGATPAQMVQYYQDIVAIKLARDEPLFFYHHPGHRHWDVVQDLCDRCLQSGARAVTLGAYAAWWKKRALLEPSFGLEGDQAVTTAPGAHPDPGDWGVSVIITRKGGTRVSIPLGESDAGRQPRAAEPYSPPEDITRIREFNLRGEIGRQFTRFQRKFT